MVIGPELSLIVNACRAAFTGERMALDDERVDWPRLLRLARFHRVQGLAWQSLAPSASRVPEDLADELAGDARSIARANLKSAAESRRLLMSFEQAGVPCLTVKGLTLASLVYGSIATKNCVDIDLLVPEGKLGDAAQLLISLGYELAQPAIVPNHNHQLAHWHRHRKESSWTNASQAIQLDLHTRLAENRALIRNIGTGSARRNVEVLPGICLPTLAPDELFAYLCVHGASSLWFRLKWITDFAALLHRADAGEMERLYRRSQELGAGRSAAQALLLADQIYDSLRRCPKLREELARDPASRWLVNQALHQLTGNAEPVEPTSGRLGTWRIHLAQLALMPGGKFKIGELVRQLRAVFA